MPSRKAGRSAAEDIVAETFATAWRRIDVVPDPPRAWLLATTRKTIANHLRLNKRHPTAELHDIFTAHDDDMVEGIATRHELSEALAQLPVKSREVVLLAAW